MGRIHSSKTVIDLVWQARGYIVLAAERADSMSTDVFGTIVHELNSAVGVLKDDTNCLCLRCIGDRVDSADLPHLVGDVTEWSHLGPGTNPNHSSVPRIVSMLLLFLWLDGSLHCIAGSEFDDAMLVCDGLGGSN